MFRFANPEYLNLLFVIPVFVVLFIFLFRRKLKLINCFVSKEIHELIIGTKSFYKEIIKFGLFTAALVLLVLALSNPQVGSKMEEVKQVGIDVYILLDVSNSMLAEDIKPNRLSKAKNEISTLIKKLQGDRIGLIIFAGEAFVQFPLTSDYSAANLFLNTVDVNSIPQQGTAIASALKLANSSFDYSNQTNKVIVVITDGEDHEGDIQTEIKTANEKNVLIYTIGMGSPTGAPIPVYDSRGNQVDFKKDNQGNTVLTRLDEQTLQEIAGKGNGKYYLSSSYQNELDLIYKDLATLEKTEFGTKKITDYDDKYYYFLIPAFLLLVVEFFLSERKSLFIDRLFRRYKIKKQKNE
ncbi:MAG: VWA domain-containing protein [Ignavibacteria bacterium]|nr:VWA domain-containing protein [Ignavibacteria bacterium]